MHWDSVGGAQEFLAWGQARGKLGFRVRYFADSSINWPYAADQQVDHCVLFYTQLTSTEVCGMMIQIVPTSPSGSKAGVPRKWRLPSHF